MGNNTLSNKWQPAQVARLIELRQQGYAIPKCAIDIGKSEHSIKAKIAHLKIGGRAATFWNEKEDQRLQACLACNMTFDDIAAGGYLPGRTISGMKARATKLEASQFYNPKNCTAKFRRDLTEDEYVSNCVSGSEKLLAAYQRYFRKYHPESDVARMAA